MDYTKLVSGKEVPPPGGLVVVFRTDGRAFSYPVEPRTSIGYGTGIPEPAGFSAQYCTYVGHLEGTPTSPPLWVYLENGKLGDLYRSAAPGKPRPARQTDPIASTPAPEPTHDADGGPADPTEPPPADATDYLVTLMDDGRIDVLGYPKGGPRPQFGGRFLGTFFVGPAAVSLYGGPGRMPAHLQDSRELHERTIRDLREQLERRTRALVKANESAESLRRRCAEAEALAAALRRDIDRFVEVANYAIKCYAGQPR